MNDGGPAFPFTPNQQLKLDDGTWDQDTEFGNPGMSLRQYYACEAMKEHMRDFMHAAGDNEFTEEEKRAIRQCIRKDAFAIADEMLKEEPPNQGERDGNEKNTAT